MEEEDIGRHNELDGAQMATPGEGRVGDAVAGRDAVNLGGGGSESDMASDLDWWDIFTALLSIFTRANASTERRLSSKRLETPSSSRRVSTPTLEAHSDKRGSANPADNPNQGGNYPNTGVKD